jgi:hypothetical protein
MFCTQKLKENFDISGNKKKYINENDSEYEYDEYYNYNIYYFIIDILYFLICCYAAYLSWSCNTKANLPFEVKFVCALFAFHMSIFYLIYYFIAVKGTCDNGYFLNVKKSELDEIIQELKAK